MSVIEDSGVLAIATRMQRLSERIRSDGFLIYKAHGIDFQPKWFPVIYTLHHKPGIGVVELAAEIGYTHPPTISLLKELEKEKLVRSMRDKNDERKRLLQLTDKGKKLVQQMQPVWKIITAATNDLINTTHNLMLAINEVETQLQEKSFFDRAQQYK